MTYKLFVDDIRNTEMYYPGQDFVLVRTYDEAVNVVLERGLPEFISFDHDLADTEVPERTGYTFAKFLVEYMMDNNIEVPFDYIVHSSNPPGKRNIEMYLKNYFGILNGY